MAATPAGIPGIEKEPMLLLDTTGSMNYETSEQDDTPRRDTIREAISLLVDRLAAEDSQAAHEEEGGGLRTVTFADGRAVDQGDLNPGNLVEKWGDIRWLGPTQIMPGWNTLLEVYQDEFGQVPSDQRPLLLALVITDGEALDTDSFADAIAAASGGVYVVIALLGFGDEHDRALAAYQAIEQRNAHVKVLTLSGETNPEVIADTLLRMIE
ncbi:MAG: hypothetical protein JWO42_85 [Chloroflexi bacterium]|jgi:hypothetical protein|nr:hypothetical protein [Chloroflexota bacterium]